MEYLKDIIPCFGESDNLSGTKPLFFRRNSLLFRADSRAADLYFLKEGSVKLIRRDKRGKEFILRYVKKGCLCCCLTVFNDGRYLTDAIACENSEVILINRKVFRDYLLSRAEFIAFSVINCLAKEVDYLLNTIDDLVFCDVKDRLLRAFLKIYNMDGKTFMKITHGDLAALTGTTREVVSRIMSSLKREGVIINSNIKGFQISPERLRALICD